jgi:hydrogenase-4 component F
LGGAATFGAMLHAVNHSLTKAMLFLLAGNILAVYKTKSTTDVRGLLRILPASGVLWLMGLFAITGSPPFGPFLSEFTILKAALEQGHGWVAATYLILLAVIFIGMATIMLRMAQGEPHGESATAAGTETSMAIVPPALLGVLVLLLGVYVPPALSRLLHDAAQALGGF